MATSSRVEEVHIIWTTGGLSCNGDTVSITAATQPSLEDIPCVSWYRVPQRVPLRLT
jgi:Ni,Fe-hydrogenase I small subunit